MFQPKKFPNPVECERIADVQKYVSLYDMKHRQVLPLHSSILKEYKKEKEAVYISHSIPSRISEFYGDFVQGDEDRIVFALDEEDQNEENNSFLDDLIVNNDLREQIYDIGSDQSSIGYHVLHTFKTDSGDVVIQSVPQDQFFPQRDGSVVTATYKKFRESEFANPRLYAYLQHYKVENGNVKIERSVWFCDELGVINEQVDSMSETVFGFKLKTEDVVEIDEIPFVLINNGKRTRDGFGKSDYYDILPNLAQINERSTHFVTQLLKNLRAKMIVPKIDNLTDEDGVVKDFDTLVVEGKDNVDAKYITNDNPLLDDTMSFIMWQAKMIAYVSAVPMNELLKSAMPERVEALRIQLFNAVRRTNTKRAKVKRGLKDIIRIAYKLDGKELSKDPFIEMSDPLPADESVVVDMEAAKVTAGLSSRVSAIMRLENISEEAAKKELQLMQSEEMASGFNSDDITE